MSKKFLFLFTFIMLIVPASISYGADPCMIKLDFNNEPNNNNDANTQADFTAFVITDSGSEVNGVAIDLGGDIQSARRDTPYGRWVGDPAVYYPRAGERIYRDFIQGVIPSGVTITLWGLGVNRDCNITMWAFDDLAVGDNRIANWYANGTHIFDTNFIGGSTSWPGYEIVAPEDLYKWTFSGRATTDEMGRIILTSNRDPCSPAGQPFAYVNALMVEPNESVPFVPTNYAYHPVPVNGAEDAPVDSVLSWRKGGLSETHDIYFGTDFNDVNDASRGNPLGVLVSQDHPTATYTFDEYLGLDTTYYWRVDEVNSAPDYTIYRGDVWSFKTLPYFVVENFNSYEDDTALQDTWQEDSTSAEVSVETGTIHDGNSMNYLYENTLSPYYSEASAEVNTAQPNGLGEDPNWLGMGAKSLTLWFYGPSSNESNRPMYVKLTDGDVSPHTGRVNYEGCYDMNDVKGETWYEWNINLQDFVDDNNVNLSNVKTITIGFGDGTPTASDGTVYFDDIRLYVDKRMISRINVIEGDLNGDCAVDYWDLKVLADNWLTECAEPESCGGADFGPTDGIVNLLDFRDLAMQWLWRPPPCDEDYVVPSMPPFSSLPENPYLPDPFRFMSGSRMTTLDQWPCRRAEIAELVEEFELGYKQETPYSATTGDFNSTLNRLTVTVNDNGTQISFDCYITYPSTGSAPYPAMIGCGFSSLDNVALSNMGVAVISFPSDTIGQENGGGSRGVGLFYNMYGSGHSAGALMAWAWGMDRMIDAIEKTPAANIDPNRLGVTGCSRWGKGALVCGAYDERIKLTIPQESGSGGAASWRVSDWQGSNGESVQTLCQLVTENVWMRANFNQFCGHTNKLPFDHHEIEGLCAPRALLVIENSSMAWLGNVSTWTTGNVAHKIWEALGIPDVMGYSSVGGHNHCDFPPSQLPELTAYVQKFLVSGGVADTNVMKCDGGITYNESQWVNWSVPNLQ